MQEKKYYISSTKYAIQERQTKKHGRVYDVVFRITDEQGVTKQKRLSGYKSKAAAKDAYTIFITENCTLLKNNPLKKRPTQTSRKTVSDLLPLYMAAMQTQNKYSSLVDKRTIYNQFLLPELGELTPDQLTRERLYQWQDWLWAQKNPRTGEPFSDAYTRKARGHVSSFLSWIESRYGVPNCLSSVKVPRRRTPKTRMQFWTREEFDKFIKSVDDPMYHALFMTLFYTGRRKGEVLALTPDDVHENYIEFSKSVTFKTADSSTFSIISTKADKTYTTPICAPLKAELSSYVPMAPFYFGGDRPVPQNTLRNRFKSYIKKAGVKPIRIHDLRHSFVSMIIHGGANMLIVADLIGDTVDQVTKTYGHMYDEDKQAIIGAIK